MGILLSGTKQIDKLCPIHKITLESMDTGLLTVWYCKKCDCCYLENLEETVGKITVLGKKVVCLPYALPSKERETPFTLPTELNSQIIQPGSSTAEHFFEIESQFNGMPSSLTIQYCPIHGKQLECRNVLVSDRNGWEKLLDIGYCKKCHCFYTNDQSVITHNSAIAFEIPVVWNPKLFTKYRGKKKLQPCFECKIFNLRNVPVHIEKTLSLLEKNTIAEAWNIIAMPDGFLTRIHGVYSIRHRGFVCSIINYLGSVTPNDDKYVVRFDPGELVVKARNNPPNKFVQKANAAALQLRKKYYERQVIIQKQEDRRKWMEKTALPYNCYTLPLLKGPCQCPFCNSELTEHCILRVVTYKDKRPYKIVFEKCWYCLICKIPFIDQKIEMQLLRAVKPNMVYVFDVKTCSTPEELLKRTKEKIIIRDVNVKSKFQEKMEAKESIKEENNIPNLSYSLNTKVFVYAKKCHCAECKKKYEVDTIQNRTALVETITHKTIPVTVQFCVGCGKYYMNLLTFRQYCKKYGGILLECALEPEIYQNSSSWLNFQPDSILSRCGYSVREGISQQHRQAVLAYILDSKRATKHEVLEMISGFIRIRHNRMPEACKRWEDDLLFVSRYKIQNQQQITGLSFKQVDGRKHV